MLFNSLAFLVFFPVTTAIYFALPHRARWAWLLACSVFFYACFIPKYLLVLLAVIVIDYAAGIGIQASSGRRRKLLLGLSLAANLGILVAFKYFDFFNDNLRVLATALHWNYSLTTLGWALPIGLSFHTFQSMAYTIEVYRGRFTAERPLRDLRAVRVVLSAARRRADRASGALLPQFRVPRRFEADRTFDGLRLMLWGPVQEDRDRGSLCDPRRSRLQTAGRLRRRLGHRRDLAVCDPDLLRFLRLHRCRDRRRARPRHRSLHQLRAAVRVRVDR
jgi:hypothetical protein